MFKKSANADRSCYLICLQVFQSWNAPFIVRKGRKWASEIGDALRAAGIDVTKMMASELCRTQQTAELIRMGLVESAPAFNDLADYRQKQPNSSLASETS